MRRTALSLLLIALVAACASAQKVGDQAAATGDWKTAEANYSQVLRDDPNDPEKQARWQSARQQALQASRAHCRACQASQDWECAFDEAEYLVRMEPGSTEYATLRSETGWQAAHARLRLAAEGAQRGDHRSAFELLAQARAASNDAGVQAEAARLQPTIVSGAVKYAMQLRSQQQYPEALELLAAAAALDGAVRPTLEQVRGESDRWLEARYEAQARQGDALLHEGRFAEAAQAYEAAVALRRGGRAEPLSPLRPRPPRGRGRRAAPGLAGGDPCLRRRPEDRHGRHGKLREAPTRPSPGPHLGHSRSVDTGPAHPARRAAVGGQHGRRLPAPRWPPCERGDGRAGAAHRHRYRPV